MKILGVDTSTKVLALVIFEKERILAFRNADSNARHGENIVASVASVLDETKITLEEIKGFVVGSGPGSFTGLRVGISLIKGFCLARPLPVLSLVSLDLIAYNGRNYPGNICVIVDAKQDKLYAAFYRAGQNFKRISTYSLLSVEEVIKKAKKISSRQIIFLGDGINLHRQRLSRMFKQAEFVTEDDWYPKAKILAQLGFLRFAKEATRNLEKLEPLYLHPKECQLQKRALKK